LLGKRQTMWPSIKKGPFSASELMINLGLVQLFLLSSFKISCLQKKKKKKKKKKKITGTTESLVFSLFFFLATNIAFAT
jgi:hypothetical protein